MNSTLDRTNTLATGSQDDHGTVHQPEADSGHDYAMPTPYAETGTQFCEGLIGPATLSVAVSKVAVDKATNEKVKEFANFELREALAVVSILESLQTPSPVLNADGNALIENLTTMPAGVNFDKIYMTAQLANHEFLRDLGESYLKNATGTASMEEMHGRHLATLALTAFKEHVVLAKDSLRMLSA